MSDRRGFLDEREPEKLQTAASAISERGWIDDPQGKMGPIRHDPTAVLNDDKRKDASTPLAVATIGLLSLIAGVAVLELGNFVAAQFDRAPWLGWLTVALIAPASAAVLWSAAREWRGLIALKTVDRIRKVLAGNDISTARVHAREWLNSIGASPKEVETLLEAKDTDTLRSRLQTSSPLERLTEQSTQAGRAAAWQVLTATAVSPWPGLDGVIVVWRGLRLVRQVAGFHGLRPGALGTLRLLQRVMLDAGTVAAAELAVATLGDALLTSPVGGALAGQATGSAIAARRMLRLSFAVAQSCRPLP